MTEVEAEEMIPVWTEGLRSAFGADEEVVRQHVAAQLLRREAVHVRYFAAREAARPMSYCELFSDGETGQIESVLTLPEHRGRGLATAVISRALEASRAMGHGLTFLLADEGDWPKELYAKLGFEVAGRVWDFTKSKALDRQRLQRIRLRTPRLELRLASRDELVALAEIALAGIHPPEEMPFAVAWTDDATVESFLAHHEGVLERWSTDDWHLLLVVFLDGVPIGSQGVSGEQFGERRDVVTGSWLGLPFHGRGYGTEMRAAVLELAFRGLGAEVARSGSLEGNIASARVSEKLGYEPAGEGMVLPRGTPVREQRYRLTRERWSTPVEVELEGLEPCLPLFGATSARSR